ncbi:hypothetical protein AB0O28_10305 [Microbispora sp. NPDC088329]|uniref:hypothetical protein n=1 Tax=Microbispora sp. NPDC088329 TaxID=3154869 RepID=UPI0034143ED3
MTFAYPAMPSQFMDPPPAGLRPFHGLRSYAADHVAELIDEFRAEHEDRGLRCWSLELIAEARSPKALPLLAEVAEWGVVTQLVTQQVQGCWRVMTTKLRPSVVALKVLLGTKPSP